MLLFVSADDSSHRNGRDWGSSNGKNVIGRKGRGGGSGVEGRFPGLQMVNAGGESLIL